MQVWAELRSVFHFFLRLCFRCKGESALREAEANGPAASAALARLRSGLMTQCLKYFVPYVQALTAAVKNRGVRGFVYRKRRTKIGLGNI